MSRKIKFIISLAALCGAWGGTAAMAGDLAATVDNIPVNYFNPWRDISQTFKPVGQVPVISAWDGVIKQAADEKNLDWRFISAIAKAESQFVHTAVSGAGAIGLMQVMPAVAKDFKVPRSEMADPLTNVRLGVGLLDQIARTLRFPRAISERDRLSITLAAYNCGVGHVLDARRLAVKYGENHNSWPVVAKYLALMGDPTYFEDGVVRSGAFRDHGQTLGFVRKVMRLYDDFCLIAAM